MSEKRFVIINDNGDVSVIDTEEDNIVLFMLDFENLADAKYVEMELDGVVSMLNELDRIIKED